VARIFVRASANEAAPEVRAERLRGMREVSADHVLGSDIGAGRTEPYDWSAALRPPVFVGRNASSMATTSIAVTAQMITILIIPLPPLPFSLVRASAA
jgi:hypothetical protein